MCCWGECTGLGPPILILTGRTRRTSPLPEQRRAIASMGLKLETRAFAGTAGKEKAELPLETEAVEGTQELKFQKKDGHERGHQEDGKGERSTHGRHLPFWKPESSRRTCHAAFSPLFGELPDSSGEDIIVP